MTVCNQRTIIPIIDCNKKTPAARRNYNICKCVFSNVTLVNQKSYVKLKER